MARTDLTPQEPTRLVPIETPTASVPDVANGNSFENTYRNVVMIVANASAGNAVCTVDIPGTYEGEILANKVYTIPAGETWWIGPFPATPYNQTDGANTNRVLFNFDVSTDITVQLIKTTAA